MRDGLSMDDEVWIDRMRDGWSMDDGLEYG